jgi:hypothetical protein
MSSSTADLIELQNDVFLKLQRGEVRRRLSPSEVAAACPSTVQRSHAAQMFSHQ